MTYTLIELGFFALGMYIAGYAHGHQDTKEAGQ